MGPILANNPANFAECKAISVELYNYTARIEEAWVLEEGTSPDILTALKWVSYYFHMREEALAWRVADAQTRVHFYKVLATAEAVLGRDRACDNYHYALTQEALP